MKLFLFSGIIACVTMLTSCIKEQFDPDSLSKSFVDSSAYAVPIGYVNTSLLDIFSPQIQSGLLVEDADGLLHFRFNQVPFSVLVSDIIQFPVFDTTYAIINNTGLPIDLNAPGTQVQLNQTFYLDFAYSQGQNGEEIDSIWLNNMDMQIDAAATGILNAQLQTIFPGILYNSLAYQKNVIISSSNNYSDLMAYTVHLENQGPKKNQLRVDFKLELGQTNRVIAPGEKIMDLYLCFSAIDFESVFGYIGKINLAPVPVNDNNVSLLNSKVSGYFNFDNGSIELHSRNSFGLPIAYELTDYTFETYEILTNNLVYQSSGTPAGNAEIPFPSLPQFGENIEGISYLNTGPLQLAFQDYYSVISGNLNGYINPSGKVDYNYVLKNSTLDITSGFSVTFAGNTDNFHLADTIPFVLSGFFSNTYADISKLTFIINFTNALPMNSKTQLYFCNAAGIRLDSMFINPQTVLGSDQMDGKGKVSPEPNAPVKVNIEGNRLADIASTAYLLMISDINTIGVEQSPKLSWKFFSDYYFYVEFGLAATLKPE